MSGNPVPRVQARTVRSFNEKPGDRRGAAGKPYVLELIRSCISRTMRRWSSVVIGKRAMRTIPAITKMNGMKVSSA
ncbi:MAG: hypothetical protein EHM32_12120 [Spirochaetales bacterium]|nr:MAG: hypothetical protein EHM32_12120 [Spirochaetales bacterium]